MAGQKIGYQDDAQLDAWKKTWKTKVIHEIETVDEAGDSHFSYVRKPELEHIQLLANHAKKDNEVEGLASMFKAIRVGGSKEVLNDSEMLLSAAGKAGAIFKKREAKIKKR